jgi:hypothetical protein
MPHLGPGGTVTVTVTWNCESTGASARRRAAGSLGQCYCDHCASWGMLPHTRRPHSIWKLTSKLSDLKHDPQCAGLPSNLVTR